VVLIIFRYKEDHGNHINHINHINQRSNKRKEKIRHETIGIYSHQFMCGCRLCRGVRRSGKMVLAMSRGLNESTTLELLSRTVGSYVFAASTEAQYAGEGVNGHGLFTFVLLEALKGAADYDGNGLVEVDELKMYIRNQVPELSQKRFNRRQLPVATGTGDSFPLTGK
jgi:hypothetical protein